jgi:urease accessory protein
MMPTLSKPTLSMQWDLRSLKGVIGGLLVLTVAPMGALIAVPALAHHPTGNQVSSTFLEGFLSGMGHPVIGFDHLLFVIAAGLLAAIVSHGYIIPIAFVLTALVGTGLHLLGWDLPIPEVMISASVLGFGFLLAMTRKPKVEVMALLGAIAGLFHGYAYGEAIIGATMMPLLAYLLGFTLIQLGIAFTAYKAARLITKRSLNPAHSLRFAGCTILGAGLVFLTHSF